LKIEALQEVSIYLKNLVERSNAHLEPNMQNNTCTKVFLDCVSTKRFVWPY